MSRVHWIDGHLDLAYLAVNGRDLTRPVPQSDNGCVSLPALREANVDLCFGTIFTEAGKPESPEGYATGDPENAQRSGLLQLDAYIELEAAGEISIERTCADLDAKGARPRIVILMEGADPIQTPAQSDAWHERGVRLVGLTWSRGTRYAGGNAPPHGPLTDEGRDLIRELDRLGIVHDLSHLSDEALDGVLEITTGRVVATHSNCRALLGGDKQRHLHDDAIREIGARRGVIGLNLLMHFLVDGRRARVNDCIRHVEHIVGIMGHRRGVALGSDMDGGFGPNELPEGIDHPTTLNRLAEALTARGWSDEEVRGFAHGNWERLLRETLPVE